MHLRIGLVLLGLLAACTEPRAPSPLAPPLSEPERIAADWLGTWRGSVEGMDAAGPFGPRPTELSVRLDVPADSTCLGCVTIRLDPWFARSGLRIDASTTAAFAYEENGVERSLQLDRFSGGDGVGNVLRGTLRVQETMPTTGDGVRVRAMLVVERAP